MKRLPEVTLLLAMALFLVLGNRVAGELPAWHEIVSALPNSPTRVLADDGARSWIAPSCLDEPSPTWIFSPTRPNLGLCAGAQELPVMVTPYASGTVSWPLALLRGLHHGDTFAMRRIWLLVAAMSLMLTFRLVSHVTDRPTAALASLVTAASSPFVIVNALLLPFETMPCTLLVAALACWTDVGRPGGPRALRLYGGALLAGLAAASNVKALFLLAPVVAVATSEGAVKWRALGLERVTAMVALFLVPLAPTLAFAAVDPQAGLSQQLTMRGHAAMENLRVERFATEPLRLVNFSADVGSYFTIAQGQPIHFGWLHALAAPPLVWCVAVALARVFGRRIGSVLSLACGAIVLVFFFVSVLLYRQFPGGNYAPLHEVLGVASAAAIVDLARLAARGRPSRAFALAAYAVLATTVATASASLANANFGRGLSLSMNAIAARAAAAYLLAQPDDLPVYSTTYNLAGLFDALGHGRVHTVQMHDVLARCANQPDVDGCLAAVWKRALLPERLPMRVVVAERFALVDQPLDAFTRADASLHAAAADLGLVVRDEASFDSAAGVPVLALRRVGPRE